MGIWIGTGLIFTAALLIGLQFLHIKAERIHKKFYKMHLLVSTLVHTVGTIICIFAVNIEGMWLLIYAVFMLSAMVFVWIVQEKGYESGIKLQESRDKLDRFMRGE